MRSCFWPESGSNKFRARVICRLAQVRAHRRSLPGAARPDSSATNDFCRNIIGIYLPGSSHSIIFLLYSWGSQYNLFFSTVNYPQGSHSAILKLMGSTDFSGDAD